jgi:glycogen synthase
MPEVTAVATVVMLSWEYPPHLVGGLARHVYAVARELAAQGHAVHVLTRSAPGLPDSAVEEGVHVRRVAPYFQDPRDFRLWVCHLNFALMEEGARLLAQLEGPVVLHAHDWLVAYAARGLKSLMRVPLVATIHATEHGRHGGIHDDGQQYINDVEWWLAYEAWRVIVCSQSMRTEVRNLFGLGDDKVAVIPNGIDLKARVADAASVRARFCAPGERLVFFIGRLVPEKGVGVLIEAVPLLLRRHPVRVVIAGTGPYGDELKRRAAALGVAAYVNFAGFVDDVTAQALLQAADAVVVPSTYEPFGIVALEAMAVGTPLVASSVGGLAEIVRHEFNGLQALPGQPGSLAEQIDRLLRDGALAERVADAARRDVEEQYTWASIARATAAVYDAVTDECGRTEWGSYRYVQPEPPVAGVLPDRYTM